MKKRLPAAGIIRMIAVLLSITFLSFWMIELAPGDPADIMLRASGVIPSEGAVEALRQDMGLDQPLMVRYGKWLTGVLHGDFGVSYSTGLSVTDTLLPALKRTGILTLMSFLLTLLISVPSGMLCSAHRYSKGDRLLRFAIYILGAVPTYVLGCGLMYFFAVRLKWLPAVSNTDPRGLIMPMAVLVLGTSTWMIRVIRTAALENRNAGYIAVFRARGISPFRMEWYVLKASMLPVLASMGTCLGSMLAGSVIVENIFSCSGLGKLALSAINARDFPLLQGFILWVAVIYYLINFGCDYLYRIFDPRQERSR